MKLFFYRKLELVSRIYILNYGDVTYLDRAFSFKEFSLNKKDRLFNISNNEVYLDTTNIKLILASLSKNMLNKLFRVVYINLLLQDSSIRVNGKVLAKLSKDLSHDELTRIIDNKLHGDKNLIPLTIYGINDIISNLQLYYFKNVDRLLYKKICKRFDFENINSEISDIVQSLISDEDVLSAIPTALPNTALVINHYTHHMVS